MIFTNWFFYIILYYFLFYVKNFGTFIINQRKNDFFFFLERIINLMKLDFSYNFIFSFGFLRQNFSKTFFMNSISQNYNGSKCDLKVFLCCTTSSNILVQITSYLFQSHKLKYIQNYLTSLAILTPKKKKTEEEFYRNSNASG